MNAPFSPSLLLPVKLGLDSALANVGVQLDKFFAPRPDTQALGLAETEFARAFEIIKTLPMPGLLVYCEQLSKVLQELKANPSSASQMNQGAIRNALFGLTHYLDAVSEGAPNATLRLFREYQDLLQTRGIDMAFEIDLFFPNLYVSLPDSILTEPLLSDAATQLKVERARYQQYLLKWLRQDNAGEALSQMMAAVRVALTCTPQNQQRAFWWVAGGLLNCIKHEGVPADLNVKKSLTRIDQRMRALLENSAFNDDEALHEMLYLIARSHTVSEAIQSIKQTYALETYLPEESELSPRETAALIEKMRGALANAEETWELCIGQDAVACQRFEQLTAQLYQLAEKLERNSLQFLCKQINATAIHADDPGQAQRFSVDIAMALLLLRTGLEHYQHLSDDFHEQVRLLSLRLQDAVIFKAEDPARFIQLANLYCAMQSRDAMLPVASAMQTCFDLIEKTITAFLTNPAARNDMAQTATVFSQIQGGLHILALPEAEKLVQALHHWVERFSQAGTPSPEEGLFALNAISSFNQYAKALSQGFVPDAHTLNVPRPAAEIAVPSTAPAMVNVAAPSASTTRSIRSGNEDDELLEVFLEESNEVLANLRAQHEIVRAAPNTKESWITIRRAFHTLKGSGRMVGLTELGEVAWNVERAMNKWLAEEKPATPTLFSLLTEAENVFQQWVDLLREGHVEAHIEPAPLLALAKAVELGQAVPEVTATPASVVETAVATPDIPQDTTQALAFTTTTQATATPLEELPIVIGSVSLSPALFRIATEEALQNMQSLQACFIDLSLTQGSSISHSFMRAAHTLAGVNRTMGFTSIAELAHALELWLDARMDKPNVVNDPQLSLLHTVISALDTMCLSIRNQAEPTPRSDLIDRLHADNNIFMSSEVAAPPAVVSLEREPAAEINFAAVSTPETIPAELEFIPAEPVFERPLDTQAVLVTASLDVKPQTEAAPSDTAHERVVHDEVDDQLLPIFLEEAHELYPQIGATLRAWRAAPHDAQLGRDLQRSLHTLKGSSRMAGAMRLGELTHRVEDRVDQAIVQQSLDDALWNELDAYLDRIAHAIEELQNPHDAPARVASVTAPTAAVPQKAAVLDIGAERANQAGLLRVRADIVDRLVNEAGEVSVTRSRIETELRSLKAGLMELTDSVQRLRRQVREIEIQAEGQMQARVHIAGANAEQFDPLEFDRFTRFQELTRFMNESVHDVQTVQHALLKNLDEASAALASQSNLNRDVQQGLMSIRMVPFSSISERLYRILRQTGKELGKRANLELVGTSIELDRSVLEKMTAPFEHLLRNAIAHGLEEPKQRELNGKNPIGEIRLNLRQESNEVVFEFSDDGVGLDLALIKQKALESGLITEGDSLNDEQVMQFIFRAGLSTAREVTEVSGRGVGMDVVRSEIAALGGRIDVASEKGRGVRFSIHLPLTLAVTKTLLVRAGQAIYAIPSVMVENVQQLKADALDMVYQQQYVEWQGRRYGVHYLPRLLGDQQIEVIAQPHNPVLLLRSGDNRIALHVDALLGNQEVVVKNIGPQLARLPGIAGATVSGSGAVILIINPVDFSQRAQSVRNVTPSTIVETVHAVPLIMVVDDSLTVRKITTRLLERNGYLVVTAKDGVDALEQLLEISPDVMLLDVEMPRMDGFELAKRLRQDSKTKQLPIIMITSRTADKHRNYALELGVNEYLGKPFQEEELLGHVARFVKEGQK